LTNRQSAHVEGDLIGETEDGYRFTTEQAVYHHKEGYLETDKAVKITGAFFSVEGKGLFLDLGKEKMQILSNVTTRIHGEPPFYDDLLSLRAFPKLLGPAVSASANGQTLKKALGDSQGQPS